MKALFLRLFLRLQALRSARGAQERNLTPVRRGSQQVNFFAVLLVFLRITVQSSAYAIAPIRVNG